MPSLSRGSTLTPCSLRSLTPPTIPVQPDHFYGTENVQLPPSPDSDGKTWLDPTDDPLAHRGIPVFKPTMEEFQDFEGYMNRVEVWGMKSGIVKVIPPQEWTASLPDLKDQLVDVKIKTPIEQHMLGSGGLFRQENMEKRKLMSVREWVELCTKDEFRAPGIQEVGLSSRNPNVLVRTRPPRREKQKAETVSTGPGPSTIVIKEEPLDDIHSLVEAVATPPNSEGSPPPSATATSSSKVAKGKKKKVVKVEPKPRPKRVGQTKEAREASLAQRAARDRAFLDVFDPADEWLPPNTKASDYTPEFCQKLERQYWRNCGLGKPAWYGADTQGSLFTNATAAWNVAHLPSALSRLLPSSTAGLPGVNTPYLYFGMWRATFAWHVEDMDLFSINYIHFGAPKFWYAIPQGRASALEQTMRGYFPKDTSQCAQFLRHKSFLASPSLLANSSCRPNHLVQQAGEFVITFPRGYHAGFNLGLNCAESVNFALESWLDIGRRAKACECISDSVRIDVDQLLRDKEGEIFATGAGLEEVPAKASNKKASTKKETVKTEAQDDHLPPPKKASRKRKSDMKDKDEVPKLKKIKIKHSPSKHSSTTISIPATKPLPKLSITLKLGPRPVEPEAFPCCLCVSMSKDGLLRVHEPPLARKDAMEAAGSPKTWMAHEYCAKIVPETWVDELDSYLGREKVVFGVDMIVKDRWNLKCSACTKNKPKGHGAPVQCTKGKCPKAFHVNCARDEHSMGIVFGIVREVEKEVVLLDASPPTASANTGSSHDQMLVDFGSAPGPHRVAMDTAPTMADVSPESRVLKIVKKWEVQILCTQHNPAVAAQKKASKYDKIRADLLALPTMARIKIRVSAGVFEVSLIRVIEETNSVEVLWDRGQKRDFKWGSVVFGSTDGPVLQKPSEIAVEPERPPSVLLVPTFPSVIAATRQQSYASSSTSYLASSSSTPVQQPQPQSTAQPGMVATLNHQYAPQTQIYPPPTGSYNHWTYAAQYSGQTPYPFPYNGYRSNPTAGGSAPHYRPYTYVQPYNQAQYRGGQLSWQQPYRGPLSGQPSAQSSSTQTASQTTTGHSYYRDGSQPTNSSAAPVSSQPNQQEGQQEGTSSSTNASAISDPPPNGTGPGGGGPNQIQDHSAAIKELAALSSLQASQIAEILSNNPQLRDIVNAAVNQAKQIS